MHVCFKVSQYGKYKFSYFRVSTVHFAYILEATYLDANIDQFYSRHHYGYRFHEN